MNVVAKEKYNHSVGLKRMTTHTQNVRFSHSQLVLLMSLLLSAAVTHTGAVIG